MSSITAEPAHRQPVHTVYGGAHLFRADTAAKLGAVALRTFEEYAPEPGALVEAVGLPSSLATTIHARVLDKLRREAVEDFRIDFEDGYGNRPDDEEDGHARTAAQEVARGLEQGMLPPFLGIRVKPLSAELRRRSTSTLEIFVDTLVTATGGRLPPNFVVTLPKITAAEQVCTFADALAALERSTRLAPGALRFEIMVETPQSLIDEHGQCPLPRFLEAGGGRIIAAHFGTYDFTAACNITAAHQRMGHPVCDFARHIMQVALAGTGVWLSDGSTTVLPVPPHRAAAGASLSAQQLTENRAVVYRAWRRHYEDIQHSLMLGFYQGWDLHPAQLPTRYAALYAFFLTSLDEAADRLRNFVERAAQATLIGDVFDDAATGQGLLNYFLRAINCGAVTESEALARTGLTLDELRSRSFLTILRNRRFSA